MSKKHFAYVPGIAMCHCNFRGRDIITNVDLVQDIKETTCKTCHRIWEKATREKMKVILKYTKHG